MLVDEVFKKGIRADEDLFQKILGLKDSQEAELLAARHTSRLSFRRCTLRDLRFWT